MEPFPAVLVGGPPHSGKSVLTYSLSQALRQRGVEHYVLRAAPDGEGDWANEADQELVRTLRFKGEFDLVFVQFICQSIRQRHLPLLVDAGGRPTPAQERILECSTHAILLAPDEVSRAHWRSLATRYGLSIVAELTSDLHGSGRLDEHGPVVRGVISGLERGQTASGPAFEALVQRLAALMAWDAEELYRRHEARCPVETVIHLGRLARTLGLGLEGQQVRWEPDHLPMVLDYLPEATPLALYGRGPNWLYAAVALLAAPAALVQFDPRLGWVQAISLRVDKPESAGPFSINIHSIGDYLLLQISAPAILDYSQIETLCVPPLPPGWGVVLSGKLPLWLYTSLALTYRAASWVGVYQPQLERAVVVYSAVEGRAVGETVPVCLS